LKLIVQTYRYRLGEIDIIMRDGATWHSTKCACGGIATSGSCGWQQRFVRTAQQYLAGLLRATPSSVDAVLLVDIQGFRMQWFENAFDA